MDEAKESPLHPSRRCRPGRTTRLPSAHSKTEVLRIGSRRAVGAVLETNTGGPTVVERKVAMRRVKVLAAFLVLGLGLCLAGMSLAADDKDRGNTQKSSD